ncbi:MAG: acyltransferase [Myxococcales bacterium]|nr:acyltransferase [Myxococcales bacterium]
MGVGWGVSKSRLADLSLRLAGWRFDGEPPAIKKYVCLAVPHTSNWDGLLLVAMGRRMGLPLSWMIKDTWFRGPMAPVLRGVGAVPIDRRRANNIVEQMIQEFERRDELVLAIPPEGTRKRREYWKSGFYHIALGAKVPVVTGYLDYGRKVGGLGPPIAMTGDVRADMDKIRAFYAARDVTARVPAGFGPIRLREEDLPAPAGRP